MDKKRAYEILVQALATIQTTRQNHDIFIQALNLVAADLLKELAPKPQQAPAVPLAPPPLKIPDTKKAKK
jgi:hypothetical protein